MTASPACDAVHEKVVTWAVLPRKFPPSSGVDPALLKDDRICAYGGCFHYKLREQRNRQEVRKGAFQKRLFLLL